MVRVLIRLILFHLRTENMIFSPCLCRHFFFGRREKELSSSSERRNTHIHTVFLDEEKEKARGKIVMWVVVQNASFVFIINFFVRRAEWAYSQRSLSVFNSLPTLHTQRRLPAFTFVSYNGEMSCSQKKIDRERE